jgi:hypothetical protein
MATVSFQYLESRIADKCFLSLGFIKEEDEIKEETERFFYDGPMVQQLDFGNMFPNDSFEN